MPFKELSCGGFWISSEAIELHFIDSTRNQIKIQVILRI